MAEKLSKKSKNEKRKKLRKKKKNEERKKEVLEVKSNIDDIFSKIKVKNKSIDDEKKVNKSSDNIIKKKKNKNKTEKYNASKKKVERLRTPDGLPIYTMEELKMGKGGYTKDCPFECSCCF